MQNNPSINNSISIVGRVVSKAEFSHEVFGEAFYSLYMSVARLSAATDILPVTVSERLIAPDDFSIGQFLNIRGQIRSYNNYIEAENRNRLILTIFARDYCAIEEDSPQNPNEVFLNGYICKPPVYRTTPFGREIADLLLAVNRSYNKSDYIPCICWGRNARFASGFTVGDNIRVFGRMQSRNYQKKLEGGDVLEKIAYEISVSRLEYDGKEGFVTPDEDDGEI